MHATKPEFRDLSEAECRALLGRNDVGRIAYARENRVDIAPVNYVYDADWIYGRTSPGRKADAIGHWRPVAFEVDEVRGRFEWRSVVVHGGMYVLDREASDRDDAAWHRGVELLTRIVPGTFSPDDPVGHRTVVFRIAVQEMTGREARPGGHGER